MSEAFNRRYRTLCLTLRDLRGAPPMRGCEGLTDAEAEALVDAIAQAVKRHRRYERYRPAWQARREQAG